MKKLLILLFSMLISFNSYGEWIEVASGNSIIFHIDFDTVKENNGFIYYWTLSNRIKPNSDGNLSSKVLREGNCKTPIKYRGISWHYYKLPMGEGNPESNSLVGDWNYPIPGSVGKSLIEAACNM